MHLQFRKRKSDGVVFPLLGGQTSRKQRSQYTASLLQDLAENGRVMSELRGISTQYNGLIARLGSLDDQSEQFFNQYQSALLSGINMNTVNELARQNPSLAFYVLQQMTVSDPGPNGQPQTYDVAKFKIYAPPSSSTPYSLSELNPSDKYLYPIQSLNIVPLTPYIFMSLTADDSMKFFIRSPEYPKILFPVDILTLDGEEALIQNLLDPKVQSDILANLRTFNQIIDAADAAGGNPLPEALVQGGNSGNNAGQQRPGAIIGGGQQQVQFQVITGQRNQNQNQNRQRANPPPPPNAHDQQDRTRREDGRKVSLIMEAIPPVMPGNNVDTKAVLDFTLLFAPKYKKTVDFFRGWNTKPEIKDEALNENLFSQIELFALSKGLTPAEVVRPMEAYVASGYSTWNTKAFSPKEYAEYIADGSAEDTVKSLLSGFAQRYGIAGALASQNVQATPQNIWNAVSNNPQWLGYWQYIIAHPKEAKSFIAMSMGGAGGDQSDDFGVRFGQFRFKNRRGQNQGQGQGQFGGSNAYGSNAYTTDNGGTFDDTNGFDIPGDDQGPRRAGGNPASHTTEGPYQEPYTGIGISGWQNADTGVFIPPPLGGYGDSQGHERQTGGSQRVFTTSDGQTLTREGERPRTQQAPLNEELDRLVKINKERTNSAPSSNVNIGVELSRQQKEKDEAFRNTLNTLINDQKLFTTEPDLNRSKTEAAQAAPTNGAGAHVVGNPNIQYARTLKEQTVQISPVVTEMHPSLRRITVMDDRQISGFLNSIQDSIENQLVNNPEERKIFKEDPEKYTYAALSNYLKKGHFSTGNDALDRELSEEDLIMDMEDYLENE